MPLMPGQRNKYVDLLPKSAESGHVRTLVGWYQVPGRTKFALAPTWINLDSY